jgi:hypothetical protein
MRGCHYTDGFVLISLRGRVLTGTKRNPMSIMVLKSLLLAFVYYKAGQLALVFV